MHTDIMYNILLQSDDQTIRSLCKTNKQAYNICGDRHFWEEKFALHHLEPLLINYDPEVLYDYVDYFHYAMKNVEKANHILQINYLEKNRKNHKTKGIFKVLVEGDPDILYYYFLNLKDRDFYNELIFTLLDNEYQLDITYDVKTKLPIGKFTLKQVTQMLPSLLEITNQCTDEFDMVYDNKENMYHYDKWANDHIFTPQAQVMLIRRGMWEMIYANNNKS